MNKQDRIWYFLICVFLATAVVVVYWPVRNYDFVMYDDNSYVTENKHVLTGLTMDNIVWAFTGSHFFMWHPITSLSHILDCELFGLKPGSHHLVNLLFHIANTLLLFTVLKQATGGFWKSVFIAAVFAVHPLNVESVAWISERKNVMSGFFWMLTIAAYIRYARHPQITNYILVVLVFSLALMSKPATVTLPFVLLLLDYWPLGRFQWAVQEKNRPLQSELSGGVCKKLSGWHLIREKIPLLILSAILCVITVSTTRESSDVWQLNEYLPFGVRLANALVSYVAYIGKMIYPVHLAVFYPHPEYTLPLWKPIISFIVIAAISTAVIRLVRRRPYVAVGWFWFLGTLVPVIGLVQVGGQAMADRYMYVPMTGLLVIVTFGLCELTAGLAERKIILTILAVVVLSASTMATTRQIKYWQNSMVLFKRVIDVSPNAWHMYSNYGNFLKSVGKVDDAIKYFNIAIAMKPDFAEVYHNRGNALRAVGRNDEAMVNYKKAIELKPKFVQPHLGMGTLLSQMGKSDEALAEFNKVLELKPDDAEAMSCIGQLFADNRRLDEAIEYYRKAIAADAGYVIAHGKLGLALASQGKFGEALEECRIVLRNSPNDAEMWRNGGILLEKLGKIDEAIEYYRKAIAIKPDDEEVRRLLDAATAKKEGR